MRQVQLRQEENNNYKNEIQSYRMRVLQIIGDHNKDMKRNLGKTSLEKEKTKLESHTKNYYQDISKEL